MHTMQGSRKRWNVSLRLNLGFEVDVNTESVNIKKKKSSQNDLIHKVSPLDNNVRVFFNFIECIYVLRRDFFNFPSIHERFQYNAIRVHFFDVRISGKAPKKGEKTNPLFPQSNLFHNVSLLDNDVRVSFDFVECIYVWSRDFAKYSPINERFAYNTMQVYFFDVRISVKDPKKGENTISLSP